MRTLVAILVLMCFPINEEIRTQRMQLGTLKWVAKFRRKLSPNHRHWKSVKLYRKLKTFIEKNKHTFPPSLYPAYLTEPHRMDHALYQPVP